MKEVINPEHLMVEESAIMKDVSIEIAFGILRSTIKRREKRTDDSSTITYEYWLREEKSPNYLRYRHEKSTGWASTLLPIKAYVEIILHQVNSDVKLTIKMYKILKNASPFNNVELTPEYARLVWIDHVLEVFKAAKIDDYEEVKASLLTDDLLSKRAVLVKDSKRKTRKILFAVFLFLIFLFLISWMHNLRLASIN